jgi:hypothetical protein
MTIRTLLRRLRGAKMSAALDHMKALHAADDAGRQYCIRAGVR